MKAAVVLLALTALVAVAHAGIFQGNYPVHGGYNCAGAISEIRCEEDDNGLLAGISFYNEDLDGWTSYCGSTDDSTADNPPGTSWTVPDGESIIRVDACRGGKYGYVNVTFYTDGGSEFTCGSGAADYVPEGYDSWGGKYKNYDYTKSGGSGSGRKLQEAYYVDGFGGSHGWGWNSWCQSYQSPRQPRWVRGSGGAVKAAASTPWWASNSTWNTQWKASNKTGYNRFWGPGFYYFVANWSATPPANSHGFRPFATAGWTYVTYAPVDTPGSQPTRYWKSWADWKKDSAAYKKDPSGYTYKPAYYYKEVFPLSSFKAICDANGYVYNLFGWCWNNKLKA